MNGFSEVDTDTVAYYDQPEYGDFWATVERLNVPFYLHPRNPLPGHVRAFDGCPELLGPTWAFGVETGTHALRLIVSGVFDHHPNLQLILGHLGETLPFAIARQRRLRATEHRYSASAPSPSLVDPSSGGERDHQLMVDSRPRLWTAATRAAAP